MKIDLINYYNLAVDGFDKCISSVDNAFLQDEVNFDLRKLRKKFGKVRIEFTNLDNEKYDIEVTIDLFDPDDIDKIGNYYYYLNENDEVIEDKLVW